MSRIVQIILITFVITALLITGIGFAVSKNKTAKAVSNEIKILGTTAPTEWEIANALTGSDLFAKEGVALKVIPGSAAGGPRFQALLTGLLDVEGGAWIGWINIRGRGGKIKAVYGGSVQDKEKVAGIMVLENSAIRAVKDLVGKTIAVNTLGLTAEYSLKQLLMQNGFSIDQVQLAAVPTENQEQVLRSKQVDSAADCLCDATWIYMALARGGVRILPGTSNYDIRGENASTGTGFTEEFLQKHPETVRGYVAAIEKSKRIVWEEFRKNPGRVKKVYAEIAEQKGGNPKLGDYFKPSYSPGHPFTTDKDIQWWLDIMESQGIVKPGQVKPADVYTNEYNPFYAEYVKKNK